MHESVRTAWTSINAAWEGVVPWMYQDILGLVTVGIGNLIDPVDLALDLPFVHGNGTPATKQEIRDAWHAVKARKELAQQGHRVAARYTTIRLTTDGIVEVVLRKLDANHAALRRRFPEIDSWPADAQCATHSMAWACGPGFRFPMLASALTAGDFYAAAEHCHIRDHDNPGVRPRNAGNKTMYRNAARVVAWKLDPTVLHYPDELVEVPNDGPPTLRPEDIVDTTDARITGTSEAMREVFRDPPVIIVDDTGGEGEP